MTLTVLMLNDCAIGVYDNATLAMRAAEIDWMKREPKWREQGLKFQESRVTILGGSYTMTKWHYHQHDFELNGWPKL